MTFLMIGVKNSSLKIMYFLYGNVRGCLFFKRINLMIVLLFWVKEDVVLVEIAQLKSYQKK